MKRIFLVMVLATCTVVAFAQRSVIVVDSEQVFRSLSDYNSALEQIERVSKEKQAEVDARFGEVERLFNEYAQSRASLNAQAAQQIQNFILQREKEATEFQESHFSQTGSVVKMRMELIAPIQKRVFDVIDEYAKSIGAEIVIDKASNASLLYSAEGADHTEQIIEKLK